MSEKTFTEAAMDEFEAFGWGFSLAFDPVIRPPYRAKAWCQTLTRRASGDTAEEALDQLLQRVRFANGAMARKAAQQQSEAPR